MGSPPQQVFELGEPVVAFERKSESYPGVNGGPVSSGPGGLSGRLCGRKREDADAQDGNFLIGPATPHMRRRLGLPPENTKPTIPKIPEIPKGKNQIFQQYKRRGHSFNYCLVMLKLHDRESCMTSCVMKSCMMKLHVDEGA